jgi:hypothetical protein
MCCSITFQLQQMKIRINYLGKYKILAGYEYFYFGVHPQVLILLGNLVILNHATQYMNIIKYFMCVCVCVRLLRNKLQSSYRQ